VFEIPLLAVFVAFDSAKLTADTLLSSAPATAAVLTTVYALYLIQVGAWVTTWERRGLKTVGLRRAGSKPSAE
jgi:hypothetical protein